MTPIVIRRVPTLLMILFAFAGIVVSVVIGRVIAAYALLPFR